VTLHDALLSVWQQALVDNVDRVELAGRTYPVERTSRRRLHQVDFRFDGRELRGLEQNPDTRSRWAQFAREGKRVMQFLDEGRYIAVVVDGKIRWYGRE